MAFVPVCKTEELRQGAMQLFRVERKAVLLVWPEGGELRAFRGRCPHQDVPLDDARFDGKSVVCGRHDFRFDGQSGECVHPGGFCLNAYELRVEGDEVQVELKPKRAVS